MSDINFSIFLSITKWCLLACYNLLSIILAWYGLERLYFALLALFPRKQATRQWQALPLVTVQLPIYNDSIVAVRLLDAICNLQYPLEKLQIQVLDDSTDETTQLLEKRIQNLQANGHWVELIHRAQRSGFKAGALADALPAAQGEFIAIFDSDFVPEKDFLQKIMPYFSQPNIGLVQARWGHLNAETNERTSAQQLALDCHFQVEQVARQNMGCFISFNGTAGVWRKATIIEAGGWQSDTITEDLDLSYRAQLLGWRFVVVPEISVPAELPVALTSFRTQQFRWAKGSFQVFAKLSRILWQSRQSLTRKFFGTTHLAGYYFQVLALFSLLLSVPLLLLNGFQNHPIQQSWGWLYLLPMFGPPLAYAVGQFQSGKKNLWKIVPGFFWLTLLGMGLSLNTSKGLWEAWRKKDATLFVRTPKSGAVGKSTSSVRTQQGSFPHIFWAEYLLAGYTLFGAAIAWQKTMALWYFLLIAAVGFFYVALVGTKEYLEEHNPDNLQGRLRQRWQKAFRNG